MTADAFFVPDGDGFRATVATRGPWSAQHQHGGPTSALLARAVERELDRARFRVARLSVVFHRPLAIDVFRVAVEVVRDGKKVRLLRAVLTGADGRPAATADAVAIRRADVGVAATEEDDGYERPDACAPYVFPFFLADEGYHTSMECRLMHGTFGEGRMGVWMRTRVAIVAGERPSPLERVAAAADSGNGVSVALDLSRYTFLNPDLTVTLSRELDGEWVGLDAQTTFGGDGIGLADARLLDGLGPVGRGLQTLIVEPRA